MSALLLRMVKWPRKLSSVFIHKGMRLLISSADPQVKQGLVRLKQIPPFFIGIHQNPMVRIISKCFDPVVHLLLLGTFIKASVISSIVSLTRSVPYSCYALGTTSFAFLGNPGVEISCIWFLWWFSCNLTTVTATDSFWHPLSFS